MAFTLVTWSHVAKRPRQMHAYLRRRTMPVPGPGVRTDAYMHEAETAVTARVQADPYTN